MKRREIDYEISDQAAARAPQRKGKPLRIFVVRLDGADAVGAAVGAAADQAADPVRPVSVPDQVDGDGAAAERGGGGEPGGCGSAFPQTLQGLALFLAPHVWQISMSPSL